MNPSAVISCPSCIRQYAADPSLDGKLGQCDGCKSQFVVSVPTLTVAGEDPFVFDNPLDLRTSFFKDACFTMAKNGCSLLRLAGEPVTVSGVMLIAKSIPREVDQLVGGNWERGACYRALKEAYHRSGESGEYKELYEYFTQYLPNRSFVALDMLRMAFGGVLGGIDWECVEGIEQPPRRRCGPLERWARKRGW